MRITFNDHSGKLIKAPKTNTIEARLMADEGWRVIQTTKSGHAIWVRTTIDVAKDFMSGGNAKRYIDSKAYVSTDRALTHTPDSDRTREILSSVVNRIAVNSLDISCESYRTLHGLIQKGTEESNRDYSYDASYKHPMTTDISSFVGSLITVKEKLEQNQKPVSKSLPVIKAYLK